ncbi:hypothetical protein [Citrobacter sp. RHBSTW-00524]|uniref:hypothetical protein n=1 Tax=Citrobacter sp. RHBSTW-00524 TaxID=2742653 RepID=UPI0015EA61F2|nr:hypothetical protein [Citrobacter sp. RHBSTW-00524]QLW43857.1 hypothetical protein HV229_25850 [Citrobacter sp. RHBSTW-00524]
MTTVTKERLTKILIETMALIKQRSSCTGDSSGISTEVNAELFAEITRMALASLDAVASYPEKLPCPVFFEPGLRFSKGVTTSLMLDALQRRAEYHAELDAMTPEQRAEHDAGIAEFKAMLGQPIITDNVGLITDKQPAPVMVAECEICGKGCTNANHPMKAVAVEPPLNVSERAELEAFRRAACNHGFPPGAHTQGVVGCEKCCGRRVMIWELGGGHTHQIPGLKQEEITPGMALHLGIGSDGTNGKALARGDTFANELVTKDGSEDSKRLDWLDAQNKRLNEYYRTSYGWKFDANFQRNAMMLNDSNYPVLTVRQAIDEAIAAATKKEGA